MEWSKSLYLRFTGETSIIWEAAAVLTKAGLGFETPWETDLMVRLHTHAPAISEGSMCLLSGRRLVQERIRVEIARIVGSGVEVSVVKVVGVIHLDLMECVGGIGEWRAEGEIVVGLSQMAVREQLPSNPWLKYPSVVQGGRGVVLSNTSVMAMG